MLNIKLKRAMSIPKINIVVCLAGIFLSASCAALKPITSEYNFVKVDTEEIELDELGNGRVLIHSGSDFLQMFIGEHRLTVWINGKTLGRLHAKEYAIIDLAQGTHQFKVMHPDLFGKSFHEVEIDETTKVIEIVPGFTNRLTVTNRLPSRFEKFAYLPRERSSLW